MGSITSQITSLTSVYSTVYSGEDQRKHKSSASLAFVWGIHRGPVNSPHKWPVTRKMFPFDDVIMSYIQGPLWQGCLLCTDPSFVCGIGQSETTLQCKFVSHWLSPYLEWSLILFYLYTSRLFQWHWGNIINVAVPAKLPWRMWVKSSGANPEQNKDAYTMWIILGTTVKPLT